MVFRTVLLAACLLAAQVATAAQTTTTTLFIDNMDPNAQWAASVVEACSSTTTYAIVCTSAPLNNGCSVGASAVTITEGPSMYAATTPAIFSETSGTVTESCSLDAGASSAACVQTMVASGYGQNIVTTTAFNLTGQYFYQYQVAITAGANKLAGGGSCKAGNHGKSGAAARVDAAGSVLTLGAGLVLGIGAVIML